MSKPGKKFRTNLMYWRFRYVTRNRLRLKSWWNRRRQPKRATTAYRPRGYASQVKYRTGRRTWIAVLVMVCLLTALRVNNDFYTSINAYLTYGLQSAIIIGCMYWALLGV
jgi:hypothetical protein